MRWDQYVSDMGVYPVAHMHNVEATKTTLLNWFIYILIILSMPTSF